MILLIETENQQPTKVERNKEQLRKLIVILRVLFLDLNWRDVALLD